MKRITTLFLAIAMILAMICPVIAADGATAAVSATQAGPGQVSKATVSLAGFEEADAILVTFTVPAGLTLVKEQCGWIPEDLVLTDVDGTMAVCAAATPADLNGDVLTLAFRIPEQNAAGSYELNCTVTVKKYDTTLGTVQAKGTILADTSAKKVTLSQSALTLDLCGTKQATLTAALEPSYTTDTVTWTSSNTSVASVSNGVVTALKAGTATITATAGNVSATCAVTVSCSHKTEVVPGKAATCTVDGLSEGAKCTVCGVVTVAQQTVKAPGHKEVIDKAVAATCTTNGKTEGKHCSVCGVVTVAQQTVKATGHDWKAGNCTTPKTCKVCGAKDGGVVHAYAHDYDYKCDACGHTRTVDMTRPMVDMFRMYDPNSGEHFYTGSTVERDNLVAVGWNYEGVGFTFPLTTGDPVHRLYDPVYGEHLYTMDVEEMNALLAAGWNYEGIAFNSGFENEVPQYRLHNPNATRGAYHFTASAEERDMLLSLGWEYQGIGWYSLGA